VAPVLIVGTTGTPGHISCVVASMARSSSGVRGDGGLGLAGARGVTLTPESATTRRSVASTCSGGSPGRMRQFTVARARWGSAFSAWPPSISVATQVVRRRAL